MDRSHGGQATQQQFLARTEQRRFFTPVRCRARPRRVAAPPASKPLLIYDGDCGFCRVWIRRWRRITGERVEYTPFQRLGGRFPEIPRPRLAREAVLVEPDGRVSGGAEAVFRTLATRRSRRWLLAIYRRLPGAAWVADRAYRWVAEHRPLLSRLTSAAADEDAG